MRMNYMMIPTDYIQQLKQTRGVPGRKKARAFMEYWDDMEQGEHNSYGFYAKSWDVSKSTSYDWIDEFNKENELFLSHWDLKNKQHYKYVKNDTERSANESNRYKPHNIGSFKDASEPQPNKALNHSNNNNKTFLNDKYFNDLFFVYSRNTRFVGKKSEAYAAFVSTVVNVNLLKLSAMKYLHDPVVDKPVGIKKFLENDLYLPYMPKYMRVMNGDEWYEGIYNDKTFEFKQSNGKELGRIEPNLLIELYEKGQLIYLKELGGTAC